MMSVRHTPYWLDRSKLRPPSYPRHRGLLDTSVVIVGGGLTGSACAWSFAAAGVKVVLLEADLVGAGATARGIGLVREDAEASFEETVALYGLRAARLLWQGVRRASLDFSAALRRLGGRSDLAPMDLLHFTARDPDGVRRLRREYEARRQAGFDHAWLAPAAFARETGSEAGGAIRTRGSGLDPYRAAVILASAARARGAVIHEKSPVRRIRAGRKQEEITTDGGTVRADAVVIATSAPLADLRALRRHLKPHDGYAVVTEPLPAAVRRETGRRSAALRDSAAPPHVLRWLREDRVLFSGADGPALPARAREKALQQRTGQLMYELSTLYPAISGVQPEWAWDFTHYGTVDSLPLVGPHRSFPRHLFALGSGRQGAGFAWLAARVLLRQHQGAPAKGDELFGFSRIL